MENQLTFTLEPYSLGDELKCAFTGATMVGANKSAPIDANKAPGEDFVVAVLTYAATWTDEAGTFIGMRINYHGNEGSSITGSDIITMRANGKNLTGFIARIKNAVDAYKQTFSKS